MMKYWIEPLYLFRGLLFCHFLLDSSLWSTAGQLLALQWMFPIVEPASLYPLCQFCKGLYLHEFLLDIQLTRAVSRFFSWVKKMKAFTSELPCHRQWETLSTGTLLEAWGEEQWKGHGQEWNHSSFCSDGETLLPQWCYGLRALQFLKYKWITAMISYPPGLRHSFELHSHNIAQIQYSWI